MKQSFKNPIAFVLVLALLMSLTTGFVFADTGKPGTLSDIKGTVNVTKAGAAKKFTAYNGMKVTVGDSIITGAKSSVTITVDKKVMVIGADAKINIDKLWGNDKAYGSLVTVVKGSVLNTVNEKLNANSKDQIKTPNTVASVRGTEFILGFDQASGSMLKVLGGLVGVVFDSKDNSGKPAASVAVDSTGVVSGANTLPAGMAETMKESMNVDVAKLDVQILTAIKENPALLKEAPPALVEQVNKVVEQKVAEEKAAQQPPAPIVNSSSKGDKDKTPPPTPTPPEPAAFTGFNVQILAATLGGLAEDYILETSKFKVDDLTYGALQTSDSRYPDGYYLATIKLKAKSGNRLPSGSSIGINGLTENLSGAAVYSLESSGNWYDIFNHAYWLWRGWSNVVTFNAIIPVGITNANMLRICDPPDNSTLSSRSIALNTTTPNSIWINTGSSSYSYDFDVADIIELISSGALVADDQIRIENNRITAVSIWHGEDVDRTVDLGSHMASNATVSLLNLSNYLLTATGQTTGDISIGAGQYDVSGIIGTGAVRPIVNVGVKINPGNHQVCITSGDSIGVNGNAVLFFNGISTASEIGGNCTVTALTACGVQFNYDRSGSITSSSVTAGTPIHILFNDFAHRFVADQDMTAYFTNTYVKYMLPQGAQLTMTVITRP